MLGREIVFLHTIQCNTIHYNTMFNEILQQYAIFYYNLSHIQMKVNFAQFTKFV